VPAPSIAAGIDLTYTDYDEPDPQVDPNRTREDERVDLRLSGNLPVSDAWTLVLSTGYEINESSYRIEEYDNFSVTLGVSYGFSLLR
jgi:hypothetical protein